MVHIFPKVISPKMNLIVQLQLELIYCDVTVKHVSHCAMEIAPPPLFLATVYKRYVVWVLIFVLFHGII